MEITINKTKLVLKKGDITEEKVDAIVNAANSTLMGGGGVDGAIHSKGGKDILEECKKIRKTVYPDGLPTGEAVITTAGNLPFKFVIHTVGPIYGEGREREKLINAVINCLRLADRLGLKSIAFPAISTGIYRVPPRLAAEAMVDGMIEFIENNKDTRVRKVLFVLYTSKVYDEFLDVLRKKL